jgi:hypothetical protein
MEGCYNIPRSEIKKLSKQCKKKIMSEYEDQLFILKVIANPKNHCRIWNTQEKKLIKGLTKSIKRLKKLEGLRALIQNDIEFYTHLARLAAPGPQIEIRLRGKVSGLAITLKLFDKC